MIKGKHVDIIKGKVHQPVIHVIDGDMGIEIDKHNNKQDIAFAHCISGDFHDEKQMSQGVAQNL